MVIPPNATIEATTNAPDSAAVGINTGTVTVNPPVNPNRPTLTYFCSGESKSFGPGANAVIEMNACFGDGCETVKKFNAMVQLNNAAYKEIKEQGKTIKYSELLDRCNEQISSTYRYRPQCQLLRLRLAA